jgi:transcription initiation factor TFIID subunit 9B
MHKLSCEYCNRKQITANDFKLALQTKIGKHFITPPPRQYMNDIACTINAKPLVEYESENLIRIRIPDARKALFNHDYDVKPKSNDKRRMF